MTNWITFAADLMIALLCFCIGLVALWVAAMITMALINVISHWKIFDRTTK